MPVEDPVPGAAKNVVASEFSGNLQGCVERCLVEALLPDVEDDEDEDVQKADHHEAHREGDSQAVGEGRLVAWDVQQLAEHRGEQERQQEPPADELAHLFDISVHGFTSRVFGVGLSN